MLSQIITCDVGTDRATDIHYVQGETGRELVFTFINSMLEESEVDIAGYEVTIHILKSDGNFTISKLLTDSSKGEAYYMLSSNDCACGGLGIYDLSLTKNNTIIYTAHGAFIGDNRAISDDDVNSVSTAYGVTFPEGFQEKLTAGDGITIENNVISSEGESYEAGDGIDITDNNISIESEVMYMIEDIPNKQDALTAGDNISISEAGVISATDTTYEAGDNISIENDVISAELGFHLVDLPLGDNTSSRTITFKKAPLFVKLFNTAAGNWTSEGSFLWGQTCSAYTGANGSYPSANTYIGTNSLTYNGNSVTISGINALGCFNNNTGFQKMFYVGGEY